MQQGKVEPAGIPAKQRRQEWRQRQTLAVDDNSHIQIEPAIVRLDQFSVPSVNLKHEMPEIVVEFDSPTRVAQSGQCIGHETIPERLIG